MATITKRWTPIASHSSISSQIASATAAMLPAITTACAAGRGRAATGAKSNAITGGLTKHSPSGCAHSYRRPGAASTACPAG